MEFGTDILGLRFLVGDLSLMRPYPARYDYLLVAFSYFFAACGAYIGLTASRHIPFAESRVERIAWLAFGSLAMGVGVWTMHFIGMAAYTLPIDVEYDRNITILSGIPSIAASFVALHVLSRRQKRPRQILIGGLLLGAGIGIMHFAGMEAMRGQMSMGYDPVKFALSVVIAVLLACAALAVKTKIETLKITSNLTQSDVIAALMMGTAVTGMHYTAMAAVTFYEGTLCATLTGPVISDNFLLDEVDIDSILMLMLLVPLGLFAQKAAAKVALLNAVIDGSAEGALVVDRLGKIIRFNPAAERIFKYAREEVLGRNVAILLPEDLRERHTGYIGGILTGRQVPLMASNREVTARRKDGTLFPIEINISEVSTGRGTLFSATLRDITERNQMEEMQAEALEATEQLLAQQRKLNETQRQFVAMASHEFRTPLAVIDMAAQRLARHQNDLVPDRTMKGVDKIRRSVRHMTQLIESMLSTARLEAGKIKVEIADCDIAGIVRAACQRHQELSKSHRFTYAIEGAPQSVRADASALEQILDNLLSNAAKYSTPATQIRVSARREADDVVIEVRDQGLGIPEDELPHLFTRFFRASTSTGIAGTGIGLHLTKALVDLHGGSLCVASEVGQGSTFTVTLPLAGPVRAEKPVAIPA